MIILKSKQEIDIMREAAKVTAEILAELEDYIKPGMSTRDIDNFVENNIVKAKMEPAFKGLYDFPASACISVNEQLVHGIPSKKVILNEGDIVSVDTGTIYKGYNSDAARTYGVGSIDGEAQRLIDVTRESFFKGLKFCREGYRLFDVSSAIQTTVEEAGFSVIRDYVGHGIGRNMHEDPQIPNYGNPGRGPRLSAGMVLAIEPMVAMGSYDVVTLKDGWTVVTCDGKLSAHYENTVVITDGEPELLTLIR